MNVPFADMKTHYFAYREEIDTAVNRVLSSGHFILGKELEAFERAFSDYLGDAYCIGCASGTEAIYLALAALDIGPGDEVITVAHTAVPTINAISMTGATPVFADINPYTYTLDPKALESLITPRTRAIIPVHLYGQIAEMNDILAIAEQHEIPVVEDCAQSTGAEYHGTKCGTMGVMGAFSFYPSKNLGAFGDGGAVSTSSKQLYEKLSMLRNYGQSTRYHHEVIGINSRLDELQAAILAAQLPHLDEWNKVRRAVANTYSNELKDMVVTPAELAHAPHVFHLYVVQSDYRDELQAFLDERDVRTLIHYPIPAHLQNAYRHLGYQKGALPITEALSNRILSLPIFPTITNEQVGRVISAIKDCRRQTTFKLSSEALTIPAAQPSTLSTPL